MGVLLYAIAAFCALVWGVAVIMFKAGPLIHLLLVFALIAILLRLIAAQRPL